MPVQSGGGPVVVATFVDELVLDELREDDGTNFCQL